LKALFQIRREIPIDLLADRFFGYLSFAEETIHDGEDFVQGAYVFIGHSRETPFAAHSAGHAKSLWMSYVCQSKENGGFCSSVQFRADLYKNTTMESLIQETLATALPSKDFFEKAIQANKLLLQGERTLRDQFFCQKRALVMQTVINAVLYIHSQSPELLRVQPMKNYTNKQQRLMKAGLVQNHCTVPITFINCGYKKPIQYQVDKTTVSGHFRWQRCGEHYSQVKLIWIEEHERTYQKGELESPSQVLSV
jgi:hypothetical protein